MRPATLSSRLLSRNALIRTGITISHRYGSDAPAVEKKVPLSQIVRFSFEEVNDLFQMYKKASNTIVSKEDFGKYLEPLGIKQASPTQLDHYYKLFKKEDDTVCLKEFVSTATTCVKEQEEKLADMQFQIWQSKDAGTLSEDAYISMLPFTNPTKLNSTQIKSVGKELFHILDEDKNGALSLTDYKRGLYISKKRFGSHIEAEEVRSPPNAPLVKWMKWKALDYFFFGIGAMLSLNLFFY